MSNDKPFRPMLAAKIEDQDYTRLRFPVIASPKLDGIRCLVTPKHGVVSRRLKTIKNPAIVEYLKRRLPEDDSFDGELMCEGATGNFQQITSTVMGRDGGKKFEYCIFDCILDKPYFARLDHLQRLALPRRARLLPYVWIHSHDDLMAYEHKQLDKGYEGVMVRDPHGPYKQGRSTLREGWLVKVKRFVDAEAEVIGYTEKERNDNPAIRNELGYSKRSTHKANKVRVGVLGSLACRDLVSGIEFNVGSGYDDSLRAALWDARAALKGRIIKYRYQAHGVKDRPRVPIFLGFRDKDDL